MSQHQNQRPPNRNLRAAAALAVALLAAVAAAIVACSSDTRQPDTPLLSSIPEQAESASYSTTPPAPVTSGTSYWVSGGCAGASATQVATCEAHCNLDPSNCSVLGVMSPPQAACSNLSYEYQVTSASPCSTVNCQSELFQTYSGGTCTSGFVNCGACTPPPPKSQATGQTVLSPMLGGICPNIGMCGANANLMLATLNLNDTPVGYAPQVGPPVFVRLTYNHMDAALPSTPNFSNVGPNWTQSFLSYIQDDPASGHEGLKVSRYVLGGGAVDYNSEAGAYSTTSGAWPAELQGAAVLTRSPATGTLDHYTLTLADGSVQTFNTFDGATTAPRRVFLSSIADPQGNTLTLHYNTTVVDGGPPTCPTGAPGCRLQTITDAESRTTSFCYNANADAGNCLSGTDTKIYSITDPFGRTASMTYDTNTPPRLATITDVLGITSTLTYDSGTGSDPTFIQKLHTPYGDSVFAGGTDYDANTRWLTLADPDGNTERVEFDGSYPSGVDAGAAPSVPSGITFDATTLTGNNTFVWDKHAYNVDGNGASLSYADARQYHWLTNRLGNTAPVLGAMKQPKENFVFYNYPGQTTGTYGIVGTFDKPSAVGRILDSGSQLTSFAYNAAGMVTSVTGPYDPSGSARALKFTYGNGNNIDLTKVERQITSGPTYATLAQFTYNTTSAPLHVPLTAVDASGQTTTYTYTTAGQVATVTDPLSNLTTVNHDGTGRVTTIVDANSVTALTNSYPSSCSSSGLVNCDLPSSTTDSASRVLTYARDNLDRVTSVTYLDGTTDIYDWTFQTMGNPPSLEVRKYTDRLGRVVTYGYNAERRLTSVVEPTSGSSHRTTSYTYFQGDGSLNTLTDGNGNVTTWAVDVQGRPTSKTYAGGTEVESYAYEATTSRLKTVTDPLSQVKTYAYGADNLLTGISYTSSVITTANVTFAYDTWYPRVTGMTDGIGTTAWTYVAPGTNGALQVATEDGPFSGTNDKVSYTYDELGRETVRAIPGSGNETRSYDSIGRLSTHGTSLGTFTYTYNGETGEPVKRTVTNGSITTETDWAYDSAANDLRLTGITNKVNSTTIRGYTYSWGTANDAGVSSNPYDITGIAETAGAGGTWGAQSWSYSYDLRDRLTSASTGSPTSWSFSYTRDNADNITALSRSTGGSAWTSYTPNALNQRTGTNAPTYDANGNITDDYAAYKQKYDAENRMVETDYHTSPGSSGVTLQQTLFQYDGLGRRLVETEINTSGATAYVLHFMWCGDEICQQRDGSENVSARLFAEGDGYVGSMTPKYIDMPDQLGSVRDFTDAYAGTVGISLDYGPEGQQLRNNGTVYPARRYAGMYNRGPLNSFLTRHRNYSANMVSWNKRDPIGEAGGINLYGFVGGNPVSNVDPDGLDTFIVNRDLVPVHHYFGGPGWPASGDNPITHTFVFTTNADGSVTHTYSWGNDANLVGWNIDQAIDIMAAKQALQAGMAVRQGGADLDPYISDAFAALNTPANEHQNHYIYDNCKTEAANLLAEARYMQGVDIASGHLHVAMQ